MNSLIHLVLVYLHLFTAFGAFNKPVPCKSIVVRKEIKTLSESEWAMIKDVIKKMHVDGWFNKLAKVHNDVYNYVHNGSIFLPFHRLLTRRFEEIGQTYNPRFFVPYWDAAVDFKDPVKSSIISSKYIGTNGAAGNCVVDGAQANWIMSQPNKHCLRRKFNGENGKIKPFYSPEQMTSIIQKSKTYDKFRRNLELSLHGAVHMGFSGDMTTNYSPNDFVFFLHHSNMDRLYWKWQNTDPSLTYAYDGKNPNRSAAPKLSDKIDYFNVTVESSMHVGYNNMCFTYPDVVPLEILNKKKDSPFAKTNPPASTNKNNNFTKALYDLSDAT
ncbi:Tyrosinase, partial [Zancudomyces culisetae]